MPLQTSAFLGNTKPSEDHQHLGGSLHSDHDSSRSVGDLEDVPVLQISDSDSDAVVVEKATTQKPLTPEIHHDHDLNCSLQAALKSMLRKSVSLQVLLFGGSRSTRVATGEAS